MDISDRRKALGITQDRLAAAVGISRQHLIAIEKGTSTPSVIVAIRIAQALGVEVADIFGEEKEEAS